MTKPVSIARWRRRRRTPDRLRPPRPDRIVIHPMSLNLLNRFVREMDKSQDDIVFEALCVFKGNLAYYEHQDQLMIARSKRRK